MLSIYIHVRMYLIVQCSEEGNMVELESYLEGLYDDIPAKIRATGLILQLARIPDNLLELASNGNSTLACVYMYVHVGQG